MGLAGASLAQAQAFGANGEAASNYQSIDSNGVHPGADFNCSIGSAGPGWCGDGLRTSSTGYSTSTVNTQLGSITGSVIAQNALPPSRIRSAAGITSDWWDTFTVTGAGLAPGTVVDLRLTVDLQVEAFQASTAQAPNTFVGASMNLGGPDAPGTAGLEVFDTGDYVTSGILRVAVDTPFELFGVFRTHTFVTDFNPIDTGMTSSSANYFVDLVGLDAPGGQSPSRLSSLGAFDMAPSDLRVITASGHDYSSQPPAGVPEPSAWILLIAGFGAAGVLARRRRLHVASPAVARSTAPT